MTQNTGTEIIKLCHCINKKGRRENGVKTNKDFGNRNSQHIKYHGINYKMFLAIIFQEPPQVDVLGPSHPQAIVSTQFKLLHIMKLDRKTPY